jgi:peptidoglycan-associated lipoprotein
MLRLRLSTYLAVVSSVRITVTVVMKRGRKVMQIPGAFAFAAVSCLVLGGTACATKGFVNREVNGVNQRVDTVSQSLEATQEATRQNQAAIAAVDQKTDQAGLWAKGAQSAAANAQSTASMAGAKADAVEVASRKLLYEVVLSEDQGNFKFASAALPDAAKAQIDELIAKLKADPRGNYVEIEGHTDSIGNKALNERLGEARAEAVKRYLYEQHQVPLHKINVISYGKEKPIGSNTTKQGRAQNRRVVIRVLA